MLEPLGGRLTELTLRDYVCSNCWGHLIKYPVEGRKYRVLCHRCDERTKGYVTRYFAEGRRSESIAEKSDARQLLQGLGIIPNEHQGKSAKELLNELGY